VRALLDANVLFSAALGGTAFALLWELAKLGKIDLCTSAYCLAEAEQNLARKRPDALARYHTLLKGVATVPESTADLPRAEGLVPPKDAPVLAAAVRAGAAVLLTGDLTHFGPLMVRHDLPLRVQTVRAFLMAGPAGL